MARIYGLNGVLRGRQGNNVFSVQNGTQVVKAYQPVVTNPRTDAQQLQRVKMALAGKISGCTPNSALIGLAGSSKRARRADYVSRLVLAATSSVAGGNFNASIPFQSMVFSLGAVPKYSSVARATAEVSGTRNVVATIPAMVVPASTTPAGYGELVVCGCFDGAGSPLDSIQVQVRSSSAAAAFTFTLNETPSCVVACWFVPFIADTRTAGLMVNGLGLVATNDGLRVASDSIMYAAAANYGQSIFGNFVLVNPPSGMVSPSDSDSERKKK